MAGRTVEGGEAEGSVWPAAGRTVAGGGAEGEVRPVSGGWSDCFACASADCSSPAAACGGGCGMLCSCPLPISPHAPETRSTELGAGWTRCYQSWPSAICVGQQCKRSGYNDEGREAVVACVSAYAHDAAELTISRPPRHLAQSVDAGDSGE